MLYTAIKFFHILFAIGAVGFNASYTVWLIRARSEPEHLGFALKGIKFIDDRLANPFYGLLLLTGLAMVVVGRISLTTRWIDSALVLFVIAIAIGALGYTPALRRQIESLADGGPASPEFLAASRRGMVTGIATGVVVVLILLLMVFKPAV